MKTVKFFNDFQGVETNNIFYAAGEHELPESVADRVVQDGRAEFVKGKASQFAQEPAVEPIVEAATESVEESVATSRKFKRGK